MPRKIGGLVPHVSQHPPQRADPIQQRGPDGSERYALRGMQVPKALANQLLRWFAADILVCSAADVIGYQVLARWESRK